ncbi:dnaJ homolog subfamily C member 2 [Drosophila sulfurigaster albostrigata]|uniref:dnaJ homolog subfamily C member 2 n=1 Tax=Drosophila sulfurigaster albostrigata TaxID=89887 RepID=UPI002D21A983|nr:dnaJ homolog subfamily C member 2 [Drosophila sulfurigaster albostrigata]
MTNSLQLECGALKVARHKIECVGCAYFNARRQIGDASGVERSDSDEKLAGAGEDVDISYLKSLDPKEWKDQDHYSVLGLGKLRYEASDDDIRRAYRRMVLQHHPDKRKAKGEEVITDDDYFTCITKAYEILGTAKTRRSYDSVDPEFDDNFPSQSDIDNNYFNSFNKYFNLNARWSEKQHVPPFGEVDAKREEVERFYNFWYDFKSWREFSYLDEEDKEKGQDRDERRWIEKENKAARIKRKKEEMTRIRALVDLAYNSDKRIQRFKQEEKDRKAAAKRAKMDAAQAQKAEADRAVREAALAKEKAEKAEQKRIEQIRIEREQQKKLLKKERKTLRDKLKDCKYYAKNDKDQLKHMEGTEKICETFSLAELQTLNKAMETKGRESFVAALQTAERKIADELEELNLAQQKKQTTNGQANKTPAGVKEVKKGDVWSNENVQLLIKAVNLFPAGTAQRWDVIATFINQHGGGATTPVTARDVLNKAKALQHSDHSKSTLKTQANEAAFQSFEKSKKEVQTTNDITLGDSPAESSKENVKQNGAPPVNNNNNQQQQQQEQQQQQAEPKQNGVAAAPPTTNGVSSKSSWTKEEQALLEQAMKTYPTTTPDRWDCIAACIPNRSKKDCLRRVKELVELVNSKKEAQAAVK